MKNPKDLQKAIEDLISKNNTLTKQIEQFQKDRAKLVKSELKGKINSIGDVNFLGEIVELDGGSIKDILFQLKGEVSNFFGVLGGKEDDKCTLSIIASDEIISSKNIDAGKIIREVSKHIQGGGGGQAFFATAGGKNIQGLEAAIGEVKAKI